MHKSVTTVQVLDVEKRRLPSKHYVYVIQVTWDDESTMTIYRRYSNFFDLQTSLLETFPEEAGQLNPDERTIPFLPGKKYFGRSHIREVAEKRLGPIDKYCKLLIQLDPKISKCHVVLTFFEPTADDLCPKNNEKKPGETKISKPKLLEQYRAIFDYEKQAKDQVNLKVGQCVQVIEKYETGWWLVNTDYEEGYAPGTFLQKTDGQEEQMFTCNGEKYTCTQSYTAEGPDDHTLNIGNEVEVLQKSLDGWWWVRFNSKIGWAPATCLKAANSWPAKPEAHANVPVEIVSNLSDVSKLLKGKNLSANSATTKASLVPQRPLSTAETDTESNYVSVYESFDYEEEEEEEEEESHYSHINSVYASYSHTTQPPPRQNSVKNPPVEMSAEQRRMKFITCASYVDSVGDGISFSSGQEVEVQQKTDSGWYYIKIDNEFGWAPSSYLEEIPLDKNDSDIGFNKDALEEDDKEKTDDNEDAATLTMSRAKKLPTSSSLLNIQSENLAPHINKSFEEIKPQLPSVPMGTGANSTTISLSRRTAIKRPSSIPPAPPKRPDLPGVHPPLPPVPPASLTPKDSSQLPSSSPSPHPIPSLAIKKLTPPCVSGLSKPGKMFALVPPNPPPPLSPTNKPNPTKPIPPISDSASDNHKESSNNSGNFSSELQLRLTKLKANFDSGSSPSSKKQPTQMKEKPVIVHGINIKHEDSPPSLDNNKKIAEPKDLRKSRPLPLPPHLQKSANQKCTPSTPVSGDNNSLSQSQKSEGQQNMLSLPDVCDSSAMNPASKFAEKLAVFQMNTNVNSSSLKSSGSSLPVTSNCRGLALLQRQKEKLIEEAESNRKTDKEILDPELKVSNLCNTFESSPLSNTGVAQSTTQPSSLKPAPQTKVPLKPIHKVKPTTIPAKTTPNIPVKPKVSPSKPKFGAISPENKDSTTNMATIIKVGGSNLASPAKTLATEMEPQKPKSTQEKFSLPLEIQTPKHTSKEISKSNLISNIDPVKKSLQKSSKASDRSYKASSVYMAESEGEISFEKGVDIEILEKHESGWWLVRIGEEEGWAPSNHISEVKPLLPSKPLPPNKPLPKVPMSPSKNASKTIDPEIYNANPEDFSSVSENSLPNYNEKNNKDKCLNNNNNNNNNNEVIVSEDCFTHDNTGDNSCQFVVLSDFSAFEEGEVSIEEGMFLKVLDSSNTNLWHVMLQSGEEGWVPASCIGSIHDV